jgi:flagellar basal-body rod protein FlgB
MIKGLDNLMRFHKQALGLRAQRQQIIASNIANADTPNYKARDFDFYSALNAAMAGKSGQMATTSPRHLNPTPSGAGAPLLYRAPVQPSIDNNTVDMDAELAQFAENALHYEANLTFLSNKIKTLLSAIQG